MKAIATTFGIFALIVVLLILNASLYTVDMREQVIITQFSQVIGKPITEPGLHWKTPFIQKVNRFPKQVLEWDGPVATMTTGEKLFIEVDCFARWRISDPLVFFQKLTDLRTAQSRLDTFIGGATRDVVAAHDFIEMVRSTKDRKPVIDPSIAADRTGSTIGTLPAIKIGREKMERLILEKAKPTVVSLGVELLDVRFKRINLTSGISASTYQRMISEREQIAERYRSEGKGEAAKILGNRDRELNRIESEAYKKIQEIEGAADAKATELYAKAYNQTPEAAELFEFLKSMDTLKKTITPDTTAVFTTDGDLMGYLKSANPRKKDDGLGSLKGIPGLPSLLEVK
jgi:membrane protease subunit HflC